MSVDKASALPNYKNKSYQNLNIFAGWWLFNFKYEWKMKWKKVKNKNIKQFDLLDLLSFYIFMWFKEKNPFVSPVKLHYTPIHWRTGRIEFSQFHYDLMQFK